MKRILTLVIMGILCITSVKWVYAHGVTYSAKQLGENTIKITLKANLKKGQGIEITSASKRSGKVLNIFYKISNGVEGMEALDVDLRTMLPPIRIILTDIDNPEKPIFSDIKGIYAEEYIRHLHDMGALHGFPDGSFRPDKKVSRAEFVSLLLGALKVDVKPKTSKKFKDISKHWAKDAIYTGVEMKMINGFKDGTFKPDKPITIAEAVKVIDNLFKFSTSVDTDFPKLNEKHWAFGSIRRLITAGIINRDDNLFKNFKEDAPLSRADAAMIISRAITTQ